MLNKNKSEDVINLKYVSFSYNGNLVLQDVNLAIKAGDFFTILGPNGSAKSTLLKLMLGLLLPKTGEVKIFAEKPSRFTKWNKIGYVSQQVSNINTSFPATVEEVVSSGYYTGFGRIFNRSKIKRAVENALETVGITDLSKELIGRLSGGQRQKVFLARALVRNPEALFLDEPTTGIDTSSQKEFYDMLSAFNKKGLTIVMITHNLDAAIQRASTVGYMSEKKVIIEANFGEQIKNINTPLIGK